MTRAVALFACALLFALGAAAQGADPQKSALSWQKQANETRAAVVGVAEELEQIGDQGKPDAAGLIADAKRWLTEGDKSRAEGDTKAQAEAWKEASFAYNMAWQYYVKAATAGLNAKRILTGK